MTFLRALPDLPAPWQGWLLPVQSFPCEGRDRLQRVPLMRELSAKLASSSTHVEVLLQTWKLGPKSGSDMLAESAPAWWPMPGLGIWPDRDPPRNWTPELVSDAAAGIYDGTEPELPHHRVLRITAKGATRLAAVDALLGTGTVVQCFSELTEDELLKRGTEQFLPSIKAPFFRKARFYLPLLDRTTLTSASAAGRLDDWMCGIDTYIRESSEDRAYLLLSRKDLAPALIDVGLLDAPDRVTMSQPSGPRAAGRNGLYV